MIQPFHSQVFTQKKLKHISPQKLTQMLMAALFAIVRYWKELKYSSACEWINELWCIHTMEYHYNEILLLSNKKE